MDDRYYYFHENQVHGPISIAAIYYGIKSKRIPLDVQVCKEGEDDWMPYSKYIEENPEALSLRLVNKKEPLEDTSSAPVPNVSSAARVCDIMAVVSLVVCVLLAFGTGNYYIIAGGVSGFVVWIVIGAIINAAFKDRARQNESRREVASSSESNEIIESQNQRIIELQQKRIEALEKQLEER